MHGLACELLPPRRQRVAIALRAVAVVVGTSALAATCFVAAPRKVCGGRSSEGRATLVVKKIAFEAFPSWAAAHPADRCPSSLADLAPYLDQDPVDPWGKRLQFACGNGIRGIWVRSAGPDGTFDTADDVRSDR